MFWEFGIKDKPLGPNRSRGFCLSVAEKIKPEFGRF